MKSQDWIDRYKVVRRLTLLWIGSLITFATVQMFTDITAITTASTVAFGSLTALLMPIFAKYFYDRYREDDKQKQE